MLTDAEKRKLTPQELLAAEREIEQLALNRRDDKEDYDLYSASIGLLERNPHATSVKGRRLTNRAVALNRRDTEEDQSLLMKYLLAPTQGISSTLKEIEERIETLMVTFAAARDTAAPKDHRITSTEEYDFDLIKVSPETQQILERETGLLRTKLLALGEIKEHSARVLEAEKIEKLAKQFDMVLHPHSGEYVHSFVRVVQIEMVNNPSADKSRCTATVCVFRMREPQGVGDVGIRSKVGDVLDNNPAEVIASGDHLKGDTAPHFRHS